MIKMFKNWQPISCRESAWYRVIFSHFYFRRCR